MKRVFCLALLSLGAATVSHAQTPDPFLSIKGFTCAFDKGYVVEWDDTKPNFKESSIDNEIKIQDIDLGAATAKLIGNIGFAEATAFAREDTINLLEKPQLGNLNIFTIYNTTLKSDPSKYIAVMSRHSNIGGPLPSQYHGTCKVQN